MKITKSQLRQIIKEELEAELNEGRFTDFMDVFFPTEHALEKRRKMDALLNDPDALASMLAKARAEEEADYERGAGMLAPGEEVPGESEERTDRAARIQAAADAEELAAEEERLRDRAANAASERERRQAELEANRISSQRASEARAARKARRRRELGQDPLPGDEHYLALQEAILRKLLEKLK